MEESTLYEDKYLQSRDGHDNVRPDCPPPITEQDVDPEFGTGSVACSSDRPASEGQDERQSLPITPLTSVTIFEAG